MCTVLQITLYEYIIEYRNTGNHTNINSRIIPLGVSPYVLKLEIKRARDLLGVKRSAPSVNVRRIYGHVPSLLRDKKGIKRRKRSSYKTNETEQYEYARYGSSI